jgi:hypothetical protein
MKKAVGTRTEQQIKLGSNMYPISMKKKILAYQYQVFLSAVFARADETEVMKLLNGPKSKE